MRTVTVTKLAKNLVLTNPWLIVSGLLIINFLVRLIIYYNTRLFYFSDYSVYLNAIEKIARGEKQYLLIGNFLFAISYIGFFAKHLLGSIDYFFIFNCLLATLTSLVLYYLIVKVTGNQLAGIITIIIHSLYTEFMVFSSVFYTPIIMMFLLSLLLLLSYFYISGRKIVVVISSAAGILLIFLLTFFFKPELQYLPWFLILFSFFFIKTSRLYFLKVISLVFCLLPFAFCLQNSGLITQPRGNVISNAFIFFGHTDYGGDGGEGAFIYPENKARYEAALAEYCKTNNIAVPTTIDYNTFQRREIKKFITQHPIKWIGLQFTKFFRTFGVVPETTSFKILYTGLLKGNLWLTSIVVVAPVALIIILLIALFDHSSIKKLLNPLTLSTSSTFQPLNTASRPAPSTQHPETSNQQHDINRTGFFYIYLLLFVYYVIATIFFGQYQERYRLPLMVVFIIPALGYFIASFNREQFLKKSSLIIKSALIVLFLSVWTFQAKKAIGNKQRFENAIESLEGKSKY